MPSQFFGVAGRSVDTAGARVLDERQYLREVMRPRNTHAKVTLYEGADFLIMHKYGVFAYACEPALQHDFDESVIYGAELSLWGLLLETMKPHLLRQ